MSRFRGLRGNNFNTNDAEDGKMENQNHVDELLKGFEENPYINCNCKTKMSLIIDHCIRNKVMCLLL